MKLDQEAAVDQGLLEMVVTVVVIFIEAQVDLIIIKHLQVEMVVEYI